MKCCGSPITSTARRQAPAADERSREVVAQFSALLFAEAFKPVSKAMGFYGEIVLGSVTQALARSERGGFTDDLERAVRAAPPPAVLTDAAR